MKKIDEILKKYDLRTISYQKRGKVIIMNSNIGKIVLKEKINNQIYEYLDSRQFDYYPKDIIQDNKYSIVNYIDEIQMPNDQKMSDLFNLISLLHNKTTYYENVDEDYYKKIYEDLNSNINYLFHYYDDIMGVIETKVYMNPYENLLSQNISVIFSSLSECKDRLDSWYELVKEKNKRRVSVIHNNLDLDHFIKNKDNYLISWDKAKLDEPIFDLYKLYKKEALDYDFEFLFKKYQKLSPLNKEEIKLLYILILLPDKIEFNDSIYNMCKKISKQIDYLYKTKSLILNNEMKNTKEEK